MRAADVPVVPGTEDATSVEEARSAAEEAGYPVLLKATAGGGGKGMRLVTGPEELDSAYGTAALEAEAAFGDGSLYLEKAISPARHVEIQVLADGQGGVLTLGERECSIQRRHQKLIEESPSPALDPETREEMEAAAERACHAIGYRNAGTFEFLLGPDRSFYFIELNARLQVEHPVTELVTGLDLVRLQLLVAAGGRLPLTGRAPRSGHAIEIRIHAEDPARGFPPAPGRLTAFRPPLGPGGPPHPVRITDAALTQIVVRAAESVQGTRVRRPRRHLDVAIEDGRARVELELAVTYGHVLPDVAHAVQQCVAAALSTMCGVDVTAVDVS